jgi:hypothetical protein
MLIRGWQLSGITRWNSGVPIGFRQSFCSVPGPFATACVPGTVPGQAVLAQENSSYNPNVPRFNFAAFENPRQLFANPTYYGSGSRYTNILTIPFRNQDFSIYKNVLLWPEQKPQRPTPI